MTGYVGSSNLTFAGLAYQGELNVDVLDHDAGRKLYEWFEDRWNDQFSIDVTEDLIGVLEESWAGDRLLDPYHVYLKMAYHLSREAREGLLEYGLPESMAAELLDYQAAAVRVAARILNRRGGVMIGDVVGLGKTIVATAIALLLQEEQGSETLVVCPKNLVAMWEGYVHRYRLHAKVLSLSMVTRQLPDMRRYRVVIVDESHNLRSHTRKDYAELKDYIQRNDSKVILLTATPYNKRYVDVANQLALFLDADTNLGIQPEKAIQRIGELDFLQACDSKPQTLLAFRKSEEPEDWQRLMSLFLVRRTRRFIKENYAEEDDGRLYLTFSDGTRFYFPERVPATIPHHFADDDPSAVMVSDETLDAIDSLKLPRYTLSRYLADSAVPTTTEKEILDDLERASGNLIGVTRTMLYKRLSSSGAAFLISLERHLLRNWVFLNAIRDVAELPIGHVEDTLWIDDEGETEQILGDEYLAIDRSADQWSATARAAYRALAQKKSRAIRWIRSELFEDDLGQALEHDIEVLQGLLGKFGDWQPELDSKLGALEEMLRSDHPDEKVLIFTEYKDTAEYVANALIERGIDSIAAVSGSSEDPTTLARRFAPKSNAEIGGLPDGHDELRVLVATDVLSEGQNLQDAHIVVNYDLPWAIVKIIQRAGRVDRVGQQSPVVLVHSFLPADDVEAVIDLRGRIARRLRENAVVFGSDEAFFGDDSERGFIQGLYDEHAPIEEIDEPGGEVDWASMAYEIWRRATEDDPELKALVEGLPDVVYATRRAREESSPGVVVYVQTELGYDALAFTDLDGNSRLLSPHEALTLAACEPETEALARLDDHHELVAQAVTGPLRSPAAHLEGALTGVRKRCWDRLSTYKERYAGTLFDTENLDLALDELYRKPLRDTAIQTLAAALRERTPEDLADLVILLHEEGRLCVDDSEVADDDLRIVCSMGFRP
jgi:superfamily II DNA or RNA helicase